MWKIVALLVAAAAVQALGDDDWRPHIDPSQVIPPHSIPDGRIVGGKEAAPGQFPHQVGIQISTGTGMAFCGGSILSDRIILTAAHCAQSGSLFEVVAGAHEINNEKEPTQQRVMTTTKLVHENYQDDGQVSNDIALLYLPEPLVLNERVRPVRLPTKEQAKNSFWRSQVTMSGWGLLNSGDRQVAPTLHYVDSRVVTNLYCNARYFFSGVRDTNICVSGWWAKGTCEGDSGGPLIITESDGMPTIVGLTSFGISFSCSASWPPVFTRVGSYVDWIESGIQKLIINQ